MTSLSHCQSSERTRKTLVDPEKDGSMSRSQPVISHERIIGGPGEWLLTNVFSNCMCSSETMGVEEETFHRGLHLTRGDVRTYEFGSGVGE